MRITCGKDRLDSVTLELSRAEAFELIGGLLTLLKPQKPANHVHVTAHDSSDEITAYLQDEAEMSG